MQDEGVHSKEENPGDCGPEWPTWNSIEGGSEMVMHTQQQVAIGTWAEQTGMMTVLLIISCVVTVLFWGAGIKVFKKIL